jgi:hypothetical protein
LAEPAIHKPQMVPAKRIDGTLDPYAGADGAPKGSNQPDQA